MYVLFVVRVTVLLSGVEVTFLWVTLLLLGVRVTLFWVTVLLGLDTFSVLLKSLLRTAFVSFFCLLTELSERVTAFPFLYVFCSTYLLLRPESPLR